MFARLRVRNFKRFEELDVELGDPVVFVGPNNSGKTAALQALSLWDWGARCWVDRNIGPRGAEEGPVATIGRRDLVAIPVTTARALWRRMQVRDDAERDVLIEVMVDGVSAAGKEWRCGLEFEYANRESFYCRPMRDGDGGDGRIAVPKEALANRTAYLAPMSGLASAEPRLEPGAVAVRMGEGRTSDVLRNICLAVWQVDREAWEGVVRRVQDLFGVTVEAPAYWPGRGEITMSYRERGLSLDLSAAGRGVHQTLLILAFMAANPGAILLVDEPDAHLEVLRQRDAYRELVRAARDGGGQVIVATHSEALLNEAARNDAVVAFVAPRPRRLSGGAEQVKKSLSVIGWDQYHQAEQTGWVLYTEDSTDLDILRAFARKLDHRAAVQALERPFARAVYDQPREVRRHFHGLKEAYPDLRAVALFDRLPSPPGDGGVEFLTWRKREIENYLCTPAALRAFARQVEHPYSPGPLFHQQSESEEKMGQAIAKIEAALRELGKPSPWEGDLKVSDEFLVPLFKSYHGALGLYNSMPKREFHRLVEHVPDDEIDPEVREKLDVIAKVAAETERSRRGYHTQKE